MLTSVVLALASSESGAPACLLRTDGEPIIARWVRELGAWGDVVVVTRRAWREPLAAAVPANIRWIAADSLPEALDGLGRCLDDLVARGPQPVLLLEAHVVTGGLAGSRLAEVARAGTGALVGRAGGERGGAAPVHVAWDRVVAASSALHRIERATHETRGAIWVGDDDRAELSAVAADLAAIVRELPEPDRDAVADDPTATLLVGLVRRSLVVRASGLPPGLVWVRPRDAATADEAVTAARSTDEERVRLDAAVKEEDGFFTTFFVSTYSRYWARWCARRGITPTQVTVGSMALGLLAAGAFALGTRAGFVGGALLLQLAFTLDCVDGQLARYTRRFSTLGAWLDSVFDRGKEYVVFVGLAVGGVRAGDDRTLWVLAGAALALQVFRHALDLGYGTWQQERLRLAAAQPLGVVGGGDIGGRVREAPEEREGASPGGTRAGRVVDLLWRAERVAPLMWAKRIVVLPIGERFALISVLTAVFYPRVTFLALLLWGGIATAYTFGGRLARSFA